MGYLKASFSSPIALLAFIVGGAAFGYVQPAMSSSTLLIGTLYLGIINMAALPLLVVATVFGLRQVSSLPNPGGRLLMVFSLAVGLVVVSASLGAGFGFFADIGKGLTAAESRHLGSVVMEASGDASNVEINLFDSGQQVLQTAPKPLQGWMPDNFFKALTQGNVLSILIGALFFGVAAAVQSHERSSSLMGIFEAVYRVLESIISRANLLIPLVMFGMVANYVAVSNAKTLYAMGGFLTAYLSVGLLIAGVLTGFIWKKAKQPFVAVLVALKTPALISLTSTSVTAAIPDTINALSSKLGFSRGLAEFIVPVASIFMRCGSAFYFAIAVVFIANLYDQPIGLLEFGLICFGATVAAFASAGYAGIATLGFVGIALNMLKLPIEAALPLFVAIDIICEGPRSLLTFLTVCVLVILVADGLPFEKTEQLTSIQGVKNRTLKFTFQRAGVAFAFICILLIAILTTIAGIGVGLR
jgi:Na+/H+-dicarboxylate symporter